MAHLDADPATLEANLRRLPWKVLVKELKKSAGFSPPEELPSTIRRWLELDRELPDDVLMAEIKQLENLYLAAPSLKNWLGEREEHLPIRGWVIGAVHFLLDGKRWWLFTAMKHDENAPLVGQTVSALASALDLKKLGKIISYAGGNPKKILLRTGAITKDELDARVARGDERATELGQNFYWWKA